MDNDIKLWLMRFDIKYISKHSHSVGALPQILSSFCLDNCYRMHCQFITFCSITCSLNDGEETSAFDDVLPIIKTAKKAVKLMVRTLSIA